MGGAQSREYVELAYTQALEATSGKSCDGRTGSVTSGTRQSVVSKELDELGGEAPSAR